MSPYSPPKSVSVLHAAGDARVAAETLAAHRAAVRSALGWLESDACWTRRGAGGARRLMGEGFVGVEYVHRVSRAGDAQLHSHVVIGNLTRADGRWTALDGRALYANLKTASALYHAELRAEMTRRLGVRVGAGGAGQAGGRDQGRPARRSARPEPAASGDRRTHGRTEASPARGPRKPQRWIPARPRTTASTGATSPPSCARESPRWAWGPRSSRRSSTASIPSDRHRDELARISRQLLGPAGMTEHRSTFSRCDAIQHWASAHRQGESAQRIVAIADRWLAQREIVPLEPGPADPGGLADPAAADAARPPRRAALLHPRAARRRASPAGRRRPPPSRGRGDRAERDRQAGPGRAPDADARSRPRWCGS